MLTVAPALFLLNRVIGTQVRAKAKVSNRSFERFSKGILFVRAAKIAAAHAFIQSLEFRYAVFVGENGVLLSGGQRQAIAIRPRTFKTARPPRFG
jgi:ABC-type protease/lipase transport system fused ATPase/permease subunit